MLWIQFIICSSLILLSGSRLSGYADMISERTRLSSGLMGILFLSIITSLPELVTSLGATSESMNVPNIASGDIIGAVAINVFNIALLGLICGKGSILKGLDRSNLLTAIFTLLCLCIFTVTLITNNFFGLSVKMLKMNLGSLLIGICYVGGLFFIYNHEMGKAKTATGKLDAGLILKFVFSGAVIVLSGIWLVYIGKGLKNFYHLEEMSVGLYLIALSTTLPELFVSFSALKRNSVSMAAGNLLGSNFFNIFIITIVDARIRKGDFFGLISKINIYPAIVAIILTVTVILAISSKSKDRRQTALYPAIIIATFLIYVITGAAQIIK